ncbi:hypothetical protein [Dyella caseinilytica]|uniref:PAAR motif-containing protein n=1 Tax=Dyella caseinilytica TaxID=1849581 RepID=A0ABX7GQ12_9GAMM|nr:hypothetical protein [Dyella caseinilytica]QRN52394.1 hypothetical protein ISN74_13000 [Dyella caseinilytica]GGA05617.1 hypothetical protein GCM10011408_28170 [Dyella caseinilytica]
MSAFDYSRPAASATRMLKRYGAACTVKRSTKGGYDPATGTVTPGGSTSTPSVCATFPMPQKYVDGTLILMGDTMAYCAPGVVVRQGDVLNCRDPMRDCEYRDFTVVNVKPIGPAGVPVLFEAQLRG